MTTQTNSTVVFPSPKRVEIEWRKIPNPEPGQVLIQTRRTLISIGTELTVLNGEYPEGSAWAKFGKFPFAPGYNNIGEVLETGKGVDRALIGRTIATCGNHARYVTAPVAALRLVQRKIPDEQAVFFTIAEIVMNGIRRSAVQWGEAVAVYGLGLLGQLAARFCRLCGARPVLAIDPAESRLERLPSDPLIRRVNPRREPVGDVIKSETRGRSLDVVFEVTGAADLIPSEFEGLRHLGRFVVLSSPHGKTMFDFHDLCNSPSFTIIGAHNGSHPPEATLQCPWSNQRHAEMFFDLIADGELDLNPLISHRAPYSEAPRLYEMLLQDRSAAMGIVLDWTVGDGDRP